MEKLIYSQHPEVTIATNKFINVPTILQYEETPLIQIVKDKNTYGLEIPIYDLSGNYLAKVKGARIFPINKIDSENLSVLHKKDKWICTHGKREIFEITYQGSAAISLKANLYTPDGAFISSDPEQLPKLFFNDHEITLKGNKFQNCTFNNVKVGFLLKKDGSISIGVD